MKNFINPKNWLPKMFGTTIILANIKFILFIVLLAVIYIFNGHQNNKVVRGIKTTATEVKELEASYKDAKSKVMGKTSIGVLAKQAAKYGLQEFSEPPFKLIKTDTTSIKK